VAGKSAAAASVGDRRFELVEIDIPETGPAEGLLRVEASGICGSDLKKYRRSPAKPMVLGHEVVGRIERAGELARQLWGVTEGDRVLLEEYLPCGHCAACRSGEFRACEVTDNAKEGTIRYGSTPIEVPPGLWGGNSQFQYLHPNSVLHRVPEGVAAEYATFAIPLSNGLQWSQRDGGVGYGDTVLVQGPGQQGISNVIASKAAGARQVVVTGRTADAHRLRIAELVGADRTVDVDTEDVVDVMRELTGGAGADVVVDTSGGGAATLDISLHAVRRGGVVVAASGGGPGPVDLDAVRKKQVTIKGVRGHSFWSVEAALALIASGAVDLSLFCSAPYPLEKIDDAFAAVAGGGDRPLHVSIGAWAPAAEQA
jgi:threonine dehydrogenase-like Zn-dependent dehydrogenase